ncbi:hypothetical protein SAMN05444266_101696 [Chitinophaga jiangningensis]|uniref:Uncharacterized protein n=1 Tax=Chitinophaga jiangningensis TaxID=1419482 RepID=A0A1M6WMX7_9BACT|nr:hypothetical protein SAMN05444266_101696 [Chitinophaga jiangningensis]
MISFWLLQVFFYLKMKNRRGGKPGGFISIKIMTDLNYAVSICCSSSTSVVHFRSLAVSSGLLRSDCP